MEFDAYRVKDELIEWIRNWFEENGKDCNAVIGISGGKDSSVVAALCVEQPIQASVMKYPSGSFVAPPKVKDARSIGFFERSNHSPVPS